MNKVFNKKRMVLASVLVILIVAVVVATTALSSAMSLDEAKEIAKKYVPSTAVFKTSEEEETKYEVVFYDETNKETFEVEVNKDKKSVKKVESQLDQDLGSKTVKLSKADVKKIVKERFSGITSVSTILNIDNGLYEYEVSFKSNEFYGTADVNPETGAIMESTIKYGTAVTIPAGNNSDMITYTKAKEIAVKEAGGGTVKDIDLDKENGEYHYEVEVVYQGIEYDYIIDAKTGVATLENKHENYIEGDVNDDDDEIDDTESNNTENDNNSNNGSKKISTAKAKSIVLAKIPGAQIVKLHLERENGTYVYEGEAKLGNYEYEFEVNAYSGVIIEWSKERIDNDYEDDDDDDDDDDDHDEDDD